MALKVVTIKPGDTIVIPRNAKIKTAASDGNIVVTASCTEIQNQLLNSEYYQCYAVSVGSSAPTSGHQMGEILYFDGIEVGGVKYPFANTVTFNGIDDSQRTITKQKLLTALNGVTDEIRKINSLTGLIKSMCTKLGDTSTDDNGNGVLGYLSFKSLPSMATASTISIYGRMAGLTGGALANTFSYLSWRALPLSEYAGAIVQPCNCTGA